MNRTPTYGNLIVVLLPLTLMMFSCTQSSSQKDADDVTPAMIENLNLLITRLIEIKEELVLDEIGGVLTEFDARTSYGVATSPEGIPNPGAPTLVTFKSVHNGGIETLSFPEEHRELATRLYGILQANGVQDNIAFTDLRDVNIEEMPTVAFERGLEGLQFDTRTQLCLDSSAGNKPRRYCRCIVFDVPGGRCTNWDTTT